jgi:hypothetical protein
VTRKLKRALLPAGIWADQTMRCARRLREAFLRFAWQL